MLYSKWNDLSLPTRVQIATAFGIAKIGPTHVVNNTIASDGFNFKDIERTFTVENLQEYLATKEKDFDTLWKLLVDKTEGRESIAEIVPNELHVGKEDMKTLDHLTEKPKRKYTKRAK